MEQSFVITDTGIRGQDNTNQQPNKPKHVHRTNAVNPEKDTDKNVHKPATRKRVGSSDDEDQNGSEKNKKLCTERGREELKNNQSNIGSDLELDPDKKPYTPTYRTLWWRFWPRGINKADEDIEYTFGPYAKIRLKDDQYFVEKRIHNEGPKNILLAENAGHMILRHWLCIKEKDDNIKNIVSFVIDSFNKEYHPNNPNQTYEYFIPIDASSSSSIRRLVEPSLHIIIKTNEDKNPITINQYNVTDSMIIKDDSISLIKSLLHYNFIGLRATCIKDKLQKEDQELFEEIENNIVQQRYYEEDTAKIKKNENWLGMSQIMSGNGAKSLNDSTWLTTSGEIFKDSKSDWETASVFMKTKGNQDDNIQKIDGGYDGGYLVSQGIKMRIPFNDMKQLEKRKDILAKKLHQVQSDTFSLFSIKARWNQSEKIEKLKQKTLIVDKKIKEYKAHIVNMHAQKDRIDQLSNQLNTHEALKSANKQAVVYYIDHLNKLSWDITALQKGKRTKAIDQKITLKRNIMSKTMDYLEKHVGKNTWDTVAKDLLSSGVYKWKETFDYIKMQEEASNF
jgi:hypothetical protein